MGVKRPLIEVLGPLGSCPWKRVNIGYGIPESLWFLLGVTSSHLLPAVVIPSIYLSLGPLKGHPVLDFSTFKTELTKLPFFEKVVYLRCFIITMSELI